MIRFIQAVLDRAEDDWGDGRKGNYRKYSGRFLLWRWHPLTWIRFSISHRSRDTKYKDCSYLKSNPFSRNARRSLLLSEEKAFNQLRWVVVLVVFVVNRLDWDTQHSVPPLNTPGLCRVSTPECSTTIGPDPSSYSALIGGTLLLTYTGAKVYAITTPFVRITEYLGALGALSCVFIA